MGVNLQKQVYLWRMRGCNRSKANCLRLGQANWSGENELGEMGLGRNGVGCGKWASRNVTRANWDPGEWGWVKWAEGSRADEVRLGRTGTRVNWPGQTRRGEMGSRLTDSLSESMLLTSSPLTSNGGELGIRSSDSRETTLDPFSKNVKKRNPILWFNASCSITTRRKRFC